MFRLDLLKGRGIRNQITNICWIIEKARVFQKGKNKIYFGFIDCAKVFDCIDHNKQWKIHQGMEMPTALPAYREICMQVKK